MERLSNVRYKCMVWGLHYSPGTIMIIKTLWLSLAITLGVNGPVLWW